MSISQQQSGSIQLVQVSGRLDQDQTPQLEATLSHLLDAGNHFFIIDLAETTYINSGGLRTLVSAWRKARQVGGNLVLFGLNERLQEVFGMVGFDKVFQIYPNAKSAREAIKRMMSDEV